MGNKIEIKRVSFDFKIDDVEYNVTKPNLKVLKDYVSKSKEAEKSDDPGKVLQESIEFLAKLGLPEDVAWGLDPQMIEEITKHVTGEKKS